MKQHEEERNEILLIKDWVSFDSLIFSTAVCLGGGMFCSFRVIVLDIKSTEVEGLSCFAQIQDHASEFATQLT